MFVCGIGTSWQDHKLPQDPATVAAVASDGVCMMLTGLAAVRASIGKQSDGMRLAAAVHPHRLEPCANFLGEIKQPCNTLV